MGERPPLVLRVISRQRIVGEPPMLTLEYQVALPEDRVFTGRIDVPAVGELAEADIGHRVELRLATAGQGNG